jgi:hypothetical protein
MSRTCGRCPPKPYFGVFVEAQVNSLDGVVSYEVVPQVTTSASYLTGKPRAAAASTLRTPTGHTAAVVADARAPVRHCS